ncbi:hypothetical protein [Pseudoduganella armeniaca]|jgi:hypothetical protein|uniref:Uncharacterized protein n=1 Tax=Pseudoduganella armeniaca TaxID=2072590 RepID=A0A2R4CDX6_9BURK|nr:hypothetical protein [Pseudoduganella armeniaca]AVR97670.1 hypothetical protein C9I28_20050 [Pseudoduganella armeniaca]
MDPTTFRRIVRASAIYDLVVTAPFATPWTFALAYGHLQALNGVLGGAPLPPFAPLHVLFACLMGSLVLVWAVLRIRDPQPRFGRYDGAARFLFATWMAWALALSDTPLLWLFIVPEATWGVIQWLPMRRR